MTKRAVLFDLGGVLFASPVRAIAAYEKELGVPRGAVGYAFVHGAPDNAFCRLERGELTLSQFFPEFEKECHTLAVRSGVTFPLGLSARELFQKIEANVQLVPEMIQAVRLIKEAGLKTCAITNNWIDDTRDQSVRLDKLLRRYFDVVLESCKVGIRKPDPRIYQLACERLGVEPGEAVFLDDLGVNLKSAKELGMTTIKVGNAKTALTELENTLGLTLLKSSGSSTGTGHAFKSRL